MQWPQNPHQINADILKNTRRKPHICTWTLIETPTDTDTMVTWA